jgi:hypothetical protein
VREASAPRRRAPDGEGRLRLYTDLLRITATPATADPLDVTFALRRAGSAAWKRLGTDDGAPYRVYVNPKGFKRGERVLVVAVARASDGSVSSSSVLTVQPRRR